MSWKIIAEQKYNKGISGLENESQVFLDALDSFNQKINLQTPEKLKHSNLTPEGGAWLLHLKNEQDMFVELCSYEVNNSDVKYIWIEFLPEEKKVIAEINKTNGEVIKETVMGADEIIDYFPERSPV